MTFSIKNGQPVVSYSTLGGEIVTAPLKTPLKAKDSRGMSVKVHYCKKTRWIIR